ncbi:MAG TPA: DUF423 domain-containing protein [Nitrospira sp.]|nr:DUF423 domain-containing protein [Nitrospira sp.]
MNSRPRPSPFLLLGSLAAGLAVAAGAFGSHLLKGMLDGPMLAAFETAVRYHMYHALALCVVGWGNRPAHAKYCSAAGWCFVSGILLFSGSLYGMALTGARWLGALTPVGGTAFLVGWSLLARHAWHEIMRPSGEG